MAVTIATSVGSTAAAATGRPNQGHLVWAVNNNAYWCLYFTGTATLTAMRSADGTTWAQPTGSPFAMADTHGSEGRYLCTAYANIASKDVLHVRLPKTGTSSVTQSRFDLTAGTFNNTHAETSVVSGTRYGDSMALDSAGYPVWVSCATGNSLSGYPAES